MKPEGGEGEENLSNWLITEKKLLEENCNETVRLYVNESGITVLKNSEEELLSPENMDLFILDTWLLVEVYLKRTFDHFCHDLVFLRYRVAIDFRVKLSILKRLSLQQNTVKPQATFLRGGFSSNSRNPTL